MRHFFFVAQRAEDLPDQWIAHCLDIDVLAQGNSLGHALSMLIEAVTIVVTESDVSRHTRAPEEDWERLFWVQQTGLKAPISDFVAAADGVPDLVVVGQLRLPERFVQTTDRTSSPPPKVIPATWRRALSGGPDSVQP